MFYFQTCFFRYTLILSFSLFLFFVTSVTLGFSLLVNIISSGTIQW